MLNLYIYNFFDSQIWFGNVIRIEKEQLKTVKCLNIRYKNFEKINFDFDISPGSKYDFSNIRSLSKKLENKLKFIYKIS